MGDEPMAQADIRLDASDSEQELVRKLDQSLAGQPVDALAARLEKLGARQIGIDIDPTSTWPVSAIFGLRRGWLKNDRRLRIFLDMTPDGAMGRVTRTEFYAK
ncbi:hypothetical protein PE067_00055 [Paracoccus sp. DMF-8]|uniref:hypothetical protein n=1 Tax=Paracoccus sp. DMF-8 TaxID=3019445 RepID=UPI0023E8D0F8|nr:hypothetical protein [Paracoccus sp. DMF-8]MDF3604689.1 hypothetical protein [Paracoccus sp. DMF-8]